MAVKSKLNAAWYKETRMPEKASLEHSITWDMGDRKHCGCKNIPEKLKAEMNKRNIQY